MTIGNIEAARTLHKAIMVDERNRAPKGFNKIGEGCFRTAYLEKSTKTVYKLGDADINTYEAKMSRRLRARSKRSLGFELIVPETRTFRMPRRKSRFYDAMVQDYVVAQEFAEGATYTYCPMMYSWERHKGCTCKREVCFATIIERVTEWSNLGDIHEANVLVDQMDRFWLIDMGC
jgi:hypothetical protein